MKKGRYEFKIAPIDWSFDYGAILKQENVIIGQKTPMAKVGGSSNLIMDIEDESTLTFRLEVTKDSAVTLYILEN